MWARVGTLWRTVRHLRARQIAGRLVFRLSHPKPDSSPAPARRRCAGTWVHTAQREPSLLGRGRFRFLGEEGDLDDRGWTGPGAAKLWRYNQHYFDDLNASNADQRRQWHEELINDWLAKNPPGQGDGWEPYPLSLRIVNWIKASQQGFELPPAAWHSLAVQARWLLRRLEWHLLGNHLFVNAKALVLAGLAFEGPEPNRWLQAGVRILDEQIPEQILADGGQFERSPMYHALALEDMLDLINAAQVWAPEGNPVPAGRLPVWRCRASKMLTWLRVMARQDGRLHHFNDSADGIAPPTDELERYASELSVQAEQPNRPGLLHMEDSGYVRCMYGPAVGLLDVAPVGPDYLPGHAHADTLSFELSVRGRPVIVNGGTSCYGISPRRMFERSTAAHSTVEVAGQNSSEVWSGFRVGRRAYPMDVRVGADEVSAAHDGYTWLPNNPIHHRTWRWRPEGLEVEDRLTTQAAALARYHLAPGVNITSTAYDQWVLTDAQGFLCRVTVLAGRARVDPSTHSPSFGVTLPTGSLTLELLRQRAVTRWQWDEHAHSFPE